MDVKWDPKRAPEAVKEVVKDAAAGASPSTDPAKEGPGSEEPFWKQQDPSGARASKSKYVNAPEGQGPQPEQGKSKGSGLQQRVQSLLSQISSIAPGLGRLEPAREALLCAVHYSMRRSKGARGLALALCTFVGEEVPELLEETEALGQLLRAEGCLHELQPESVLEAVVGLGIFLRRCEHLQGQAALRWRPLAQALLAQALVQAATCFPETLDDLDLRVEEVLSGAVALAEDSIAADPTMPDGHVALAQLILCHELSEAVQDAMEVLHHALALDGNHDPADIALAVAWYHQGNTVEALEAIERVLRRGNAQPLPLLLRAALYRQSGRLEESKGDLQRARKLAPGISLSLSGESDRGEEEGEGKEHP